MKLTCETAARTYASYANAVKAAEKLTGLGDLRYLIAATPDGRFFPVAIGMAAIDAGAHFHLTVVA